MCQNYDRICNCEDQIIFGELKAMANVTLDLIKQLRESTGVGMMDCKQALTEADGNIEKATELLRKKGISVAAKRSGNATENGIIDGSVDAQFKKASLIEVSCETDFAARTADMKAFANKLSQSFMHQGTMHENVDPFLAMVIKDTSLTAKNMLDDLISKISESIILSKVEVSSSSDSELVNIYLHPDGTLGVLVQIEADKAMTGDHRKAVAVLAKDLAMQVAVTNPLSISDKDLSPAVIEKEREIASATIKDSGKPAQIIEKIIDGKLNKFFEENCLVSQRFIKDDKLSVSDYINSVGKQEGLILKVKKFARFGIKR